MASADTSSIAYSYIRFSHADQARGDSLRRQTEAAADWCARHKIRLDTATTFRDLGKSAYTGKHRQNPDRHALAAFLKLAEQGKVPRGSYLVIENLDRLSREHIRPALSLLLNLIDQGIRVVQLKPVEQVFGEDVEPMQLMMAIMELNRGHSESEMKSDRIGKAWREKKAKARNGEHQPPRRKDGRVTKALTARLPAWVEDRGGELHLIPTRVAALKRIFQLAGNGYGHVRIVKKLGEERVPAFGGRVWVPDPDGPDKGHWRAADGERYGTGQWNRAYVAQLLRDERVLGTYQPLDRDGKPDGPPIENYYPAAITPNEWAAARGGADRRKQGNGRSTKHVDVFAGLVEDALGGGAYYCATRTHRGKHSRVLINTESGEGRAPARSFPYPVFEEAVLSLLREVDPRDVLGKDGATDEVLVLAGELERVETSIALIVAEMDEHGESPTLFRRLRAKEAAQRELAARKAEAQQRAANPLPAAWGEAQSLSGTLRDAPDPDDARTRLRTVLRRVVSRILLLVVPRKRDRLAAVQIYFAGGDRRRNYLILHRPALAYRKVRTEGRWWARSLADVAAPGDLDLRDRGDARKLEDLLDRLDITELWEKMA
jgi:DNA invertase Pin-like site-specific DNA recombinase